MFWPMSFPGKVLMLSGPGSFNAAYIRRMLEVCGITVLTSADAPNQVLADLPGNDLSAIVACLVVDLEPASIGEIETQRWPFPFLFVGSQSAAAYPDSLYWIQAPFASYQVMERLMTLALPSWGLAEH